MKDQQVDAASLAARFILQKLCMCMMSFYESLITFSNKLLCSGKIILLGFLYRLNIAAARSSYRRNNLKCYKL